MPSTPARGPAEGRPAGSAVPAAFEATWEPPTSVSPGASNPLGDQVRLSLKLVVLLDRWGSPGDNGSAPREMTQQGLAEALSVTQGALSKVLGRLAAADMVIAERRHVRGIARRIHVYSLTRDGRAIAREIRERFGLPSPRPWER